MCIENYQPGEEENLQEAPEAENPLEVINNPYDSIFKQVLKENPKGLLKMLGIEGDFSLMEKNVELKRTSHLNVDAAFWVKYPESEEFPEGEQFLLHIEFQKRWVKNMPSRMGEYAIELALTNAERDKNGEILKWPEIESHVVYFWPDEGKNDPEGITISKRANLKPTYKKFLLYEKTFDELKETQLWEYLTFAPTLKNITDEELREANEILIKHAGNDAKKRGRLLLMFAFLFKKRYRKERNLHEVIPNFDTMADNEAGFALSVLTKEEREQSEQKGIQKVLQLLPEEQRKAISHKLLNTLNTSPQPQDGSLTADPR